jgi:hypothetical protein
MLLAVVARRSSNARFSTDTTASSRAARVTVARPAATFRVLLELQEIRDGKEGKEEGQEKVREEGLPQEEDRSPLQGDVIRTNRAARSGGPLPFLETDIKKPPTAGPANAGPVVVLSLIPLKPPLCAG